VGEAPCHCFWAPVLRAGSRIGSLGRNCDRVALDGCGKGRRMFEAGGAKEVREGDKGKWLDEGRMEEMGRGGSRWAKKRRCSVFGFGA
jgi:hypothetical protein